MNKQDKQIVILGAGTAGLTLANKLARKKYKPILIDPNPNHYYQTGILQTIFGGLNTDNLKRSVAELINKRVEYIYDKVIGIDPKNSRITLANNQTIHYDVLVIATGVYADPNLTPGLMSENWQTNIFEFYTPEGAKELSAALDLFTSGNLIMQIMEVPIKSPLAPLEFCFLADDYFTKKGLRNKINITLVTPLPGPFTNPLVSNKLTALMSQKRIGLISNFNIDRVEPRVNQLIGKDGSTINYDLLVTVPATVGMKFLQKTDFTNPLGFVNVNKKSLQSVVYANIFSLGDAADTPAPKVGSVAHYQTETVLNNIELYLNNNQVSESYDGHANIFVELGSDEAMLLDYNYDTEPLEGNFPFTHIGPLKLVAATKLNHKANMIFRHLYWLLLLSGNKIPFLTNKMLLRGKKI